MYVCDVGGDVRVVNVIVHPGKSVSCVMVVGCISREGVVSRCQCLFLNE